jgi:TonB family protein
VTAPVVKKNDGVAYPKQAVDEGVRDTVDVPVILDVSASGAVTKVVVETPAGHGFDEAVVAAAKTLEFEPATRGGKPVAARIRFNYHLVPPPGAMSGRVVTSAGEHPVAGALVVVRAPSGVEQSVTTGPDGAWHVDGLDAGTYHVTIHATGRVPHESDETVQLAEEVTSVDRLDLEQAAQSSPAATGADDVTDVEVHGTKPPRSVTVRTLEQREINRIPGTNGDALRSLQNLPGVGRPPALAGLLIVRGAAPQDSSYFVDGTPVPIVYHFGGLSSVVPTEMISKLDFYPGNFSTQFGRAQGGIVDVGLLDPSKDALHGLVEVDLLDSRVLAQGPIFDTGWRFAIAGRRSYLDVWLGPTLKALKAGVDASPVYYDYQAILEKDLSSRSSIRFAFFGSDDKLTILNTNVSSGEPEFSGNIATHTGFWRGQVLYKNRFTDSTEFRAVAAFGRDSTSFSAGNISFNLVDYPITGRIELAQKLNKWLTMNVGFDVIDSPYTVTAHLPPFPKEGQPPTGPFSQQTLLSTATSASIYEPAMYVEWEATPWKGARIVPGIRLDYTKDTGAWDFDPRITVRQDVTESPRTTLKGGVGVFSQPPQPQDTNVVFGTPGLTDERAIHYDLGIEREVTRNIDFSLEGFYKQLDYQVNSGVGSTGSGVIYGGETLIRYKPDAHFFGWLAYTISRSLLRDQPGAPLRLSQFDETHILTVLGSYRLGRGWEFGARYRLTSGYMFTPNTYGFYDENIGTYLSQVAFPPNGSRLPLFQQLDLRVDKTWKFKWGSVGAYLDVLNVFNNGNVAGISYNFNATQTSYVGDLPILPSLGVHVEF